MARTGEREFLLILPSLKLDAVESRCENLAGLLRRAAVQTYGKETVSLRVGAASFPEDGATTEVLLAEAESRRRRKSPLLIGILSDGVLLTRKLKVFLCHSSDDKAAVRSLYDRLCNEGIDAWLDEKKLVGGQDWDREVTMAVRSSDIKHALDVADEQPEGAIFIIPLRLEECHVPERLKKWHWVNALEHGAHDKLLRCPLRSCG